MPARTSSTIVLICELGSVRADPHVVELLARLQLLAHRLGGELRLRDCPDDLRLLLELTGLAEVLGLEPRGQSEQGEQPLGAEEEGEIDDPPT
jgi:anti-anti-sigma regulatory factor